LEPARLQELRPKRAGSRVRNPVDVTVRAREEGVISRKVFVGNLNYATTAKELEDLFAGVGPVSSVVLPSDRTTGRPRGFAFVEFEEEETAAQAIQKLDGQELGGRNIRVNAAEDRPRRPPGSGPSGPGSRPSFTPGPPDFPPDGFGDGFPPRARPKGSRRNIRSRKRGF
jgi:RNA recognition motif-containing protein